MSSEKRIDALDDVRDVIASYNLPPIKQRKFNGIFNAMGLFVCGYHRRNLIEIPIATIEEVKGRTLNKHLIEDYCMWFWNYR